MRLLAREGFALTLVLWLLVGGAALALGLASSSQSALQASANRIMLERGRWYAEGCIERLRAVVDDTLRSMPAEAERGWRSLDSMVMRSPLLTGCDLAIHPIGTTLNANTASAAEIATALRADGLTDAADSIADAITDWRDGDSDPRPLGAESAWYAGEDLPSPRNAPFRSREELRLVRGVRDLRLLDIEDGRLLLGRASASILASLPGFGPEAIARATTFNDDLQPATLLDFTTRLSPPARAELLAHFIELDKRIACSPDAWIVKARSIAGSPPIEVNVEVKLVRAANRAAVTRWRSWP